MWNLITVHLSINVSKDLGMEGDSLRRSGSCATRELENEIEFADVASTRGLTGMREGGQLQTNRTGVIDSDVCDQSRGGHGRYGATVTFKGSHYKSCQSSVGPDRFTRREVLETCFSAT